MIAKVLLVGGALLVGLVCLTLIVVALIYLTYCLVAPRFENRKA
jgi:hypothetical protein